MDTVSAADLQFELKVLLDQAPADRSLPDLQRLGRTLFSAGHTEAALAAFEALVECGMADAALWRTITGLRLQLQLPHLALDAARRATELAPDSADAWYNFGLLLGETGSDIDALQAYKRALCIDASHYGSMRNLPVLLARMGLTEEARAAGQAVLKAYPDDPWLHFNSGDLLIGMRASAQAEAAFQQALALAPDFHQARYALSIALAAQGRVREAQIERAAALASEPGLIDEYKSPLLLGESAQDEEASPGRVAVVAAFEELRLGDWHRYDEISTLIYGLIKGEYDNPPLDQPEMPYSALSLPIDSATFQQLARQVAHRVQNNMLAERLVRPPRADGKLLNIGYISANFRPHPNARLMGQLYARHDRSRFKIHAYSLGPIQDSAERDRVMADVDVFRDLVRLPATAAAQLIVNDGIDILVDLSGYARYARPEVLALRPAQIQLSYVGYMATMGASFMDYALLDHESLLPEVREYWDEKVAYLPHCSYHCELPEGLPPTPSRAELGLPPSGLIFGALHHPRKLEPMTWACWMDLLKEIPSASLWLLYETAEQREQLLRNAAAYGVAPERLVFSEQIEHTTHLARLGCADIFLDTFVYNGHTTTVDALGVGVPVVTLSGESVVARIAGSMLKAHGLPELRANSVEEYKSLVYRLASDDAWRQAMTLRARDHLASKLFRPECRVKELEAAYELMWARHKGGLPPEDFDVPEFPSA